MITKNTNHVQESRDNFVSQFRGKTNIQALSDSFAQQIQELENALFQLLDERDIENGVGAQLDNIGRIVGQSRADRTDEEYRFFLRARIFANKSNGTIEDIIRVAKLITGGVDVILQEFFPAGITVTVDNFTEDPAQVAELIRSSRPAGVKADFIFSPVNPPFQFDTPGQGFDLGEYADVTEA